VLDPCDEPKFVPEMVTRMPTAPNVGDTPLMVGVGFTVKLLPALGSPSTVTTTLPVLAPAGTGALIWVLFQLVGVAAVPLNVTVLLPMLWLAWKLEPLIVTDAPTAPDVGDKLLIVGVTKTVKLAPALGTPETVTTTFPVVAPLGTETVMLVALQQVLHGDAAVPLNFTVLLPCDDPKFVPVIVTESPIIPEVGERLVIVGVGNTVKLTPLLSTPLACTTTFPVVAPEGTGALMVVEFQEVGVATVPLNLIVPEWVNFNSHC